MCGEHAGSVSALPVRPRTMAVLLPVLVAAAILAVVLLESDFWADLVHVARRLTVAGSFVGLYLEESGVPLPVSGDVFVVYLGHHLGGSPGELALVWLGLVATVLAGSTNLYFISRRWGRRLVEGRLGLL